MTVRRFLSGVAIATAAFLSTAGVAGAQSTGTPTTGSAGSTGSTTPSTVEQLFVQTATGGAIKPVAGKAGVYSLTLQGVPAEVTSFTDRPLRVRSGLTTADFVGIWNGGTFDASPPNAALVIDGAPTTRDTFVFTLTNPKYDAKSKQITYSAKIVTDAPRGRLVDLADDVDPNPPQRFRRASLFVDSSPVKGMTVTISNLPPNDQAHYQLSNGFTELSFVDALQGNLTEAFSGARGNSVYSGAPGAGDGTVTVVLGVALCVDPGETTSSVTLNGSPSATYTFDLGNGSQTFTNNASGILTVPADFQLQGCAL